jgi:hypothetical protein
MMGVEGWSVVNQEEECEVAVRHIVFMLLVISMLVCSSCKSAIEQEEANVYGSYINKHYITRDFVDHRFDNKPFKMIVIGDPTPGSVERFFFSNPLRHI